MKKWLERLRKRRQRYRDIFESEDGKWVLADLARACGRSQDPHTAGDPHTTAYLVGRQWVILHILKVMQMTDAEIDQLVRQQEFAEARAQGEVYEDDIQRDREDFYHA